MSEHHRIEMIEIPAASAAELDATRTFLTTVFGWTFTAWGDDYSDTTDSGTGIGVNADGNQSMPLIVVYSDDLDATRASVIAAGGTVIVDTYDFPGGRRFHFTEPNGSELAVWSR